MGLVLICTGLAWGQPYAFQALGRTWKCSLDPLPCKSYRPQTSDFMWPSFSAPRLNLVFHRAAPEATFEEELYFAFGESLKIAARRNPQGCSLAQGRGFCAAFVPRSRLESLILELVHQMPSL